MAGLRRESRVRHAWAASLIVLVVILGLDFSVKQVANFWKNRKTGTPEKVSAPPEASHRHFSEDYHHGFTPLTHGREIYGPYEVDYFINSLGMRDRSERQISRTKPPKGRVLLLGDSFIDGVGMNFEDTVAGRLLARLSPRGIEVLNGGVASYCPTLIEARLQKWILKDHLEFDLVLVFIDISDVRDEMRYHRNSSGSFQPNDSVEFESAIHADEVKNRPFRAMLESRVEKNFVILGALIRNLRQQYEKLPFAGSSMPFEHNRWPSYDGPLNPWVQQALQRQAVSMCKILELSREQKANLAVVVYPGIEQIQDKYAEDRHVRFWRDWTSVQKVTLISLYPDFIKIRHQLNEYILSPRDSHWNARGAELVATALLQSGVFDKLLQRSERGR